MTIKVKLDSQGDSAVKIAILVPCYNEQATVSAVVEGFSKALPGAVVYVYDNNSEDRTAELARQCGAVVRSELRPGKGNVVRRMFSDIDADAYIMVDGDATYDPSIAPRLVAEIVDRQLDFVNVRRISSEKEAYRRGHAFGNRVLTASVSKIFGNHCDDMLSGYKAFSRRFVKSFPAVSSGFEIETEIVIHALELRAPSVEIAAPYGSRPKGSISKLRTFRDGWRIVRVIGRLVVEERPMTVFSLLAAMLLLAAIVLGIPLVVTYPETGLVQRIPTAIVVMGLAVASLLSLMTGTILYFVTITRREVKRLLYLQS